MKEINEVKRATTATSVTGHRCNAAEKENAKRERGGGMKERKRRTRKTDRESGGRQRGMESRSRADRESTTEKINNLSTIILYRKVLCYNNNNKKYQLLYEKI